MKKYIYVIFARIECVLLKFVLSFTKQVRFKRGSYINKHVFFEGKNSVHKKACVINSYVGYGTFIGQLSNINKVRIGKFCSIGPKVSIISGSHPVNNFVTTHPAFFSLLKQAGFTFTKKQLFPEYKYADNENNYSVIIGNDVWIGANVSIMEGVKIEDGAIIGAKALVTKDVEPYSICYGIPAKIERYRFKKKYIDFLLKFKWWDRKIEWIKDNSGLFCDVRRFYEKNYFDKSEVINDVQ